MQVCDLRRNLFLYFLRSADAPELAERIHIKWKIVQLVLVHRYRRINVIVELRQLVYVIPNLFVARVENVCAVTVHLNAVHILGIDISSNVASFVDHKTALSCQRHLMCKHRTEQSGADNQIIVLFSFFSHLFSLLFFVCMCRCFLLRQICIAHRA